MPMATKMIACQFYHISFCPLSQETVSMSSNLSYGPPKEGIYNISLKYQKDTLRSIKANPWNYVFLITSDTWLAIIAFSERNIDLSNKNGPSLLCCTLIHWKRRTESLLQQPLQIAADSRCRVCTFEETENSPGNYFHKRTTSQYGQTPFQIYTGQIIALL